MFLVAQIYTSFVMVSPVDTSMVYASNHSLYTSLYWYGRLHYCLRQQRESVIAETHLGLGLCSPAALQLCLRKTLQENNHTLFNDIMLCTASSWSEALK